MFRYLLVVLIFWYQTQRYASASSDTTQSVTRPILPMLESPDKHNSSENAEEVEKKFIVAMNGNNTYHVDQVIFYLNDRYKEMYNDQKIKKRYPDDYIVTPGIGVHKFHNAIRLTWNRARHACIQEGGHLAVINSDSEEKILLDMMKDKNILDSWIGVHDQFEEGYWVTINDVPLENTGYTKWSNKWGSILPDNAGGNQNCAYLVQPEGGMDDYRCDDEASFFCEIPA